MINSPYKISASSFYNLSKCHRRVYLDLYGDPNEKGEFSDFLQLLWEKGLQIEREILEKIKKEVEVETVEGKPGPESFDQTLGLMRKGTSLIYQGVLIQGDYIGRPDILERQEGNSVFGVYHYIPCDIKSGRATENKEDGDIKKHYANQMLFYAELLEQIQGKKPEIGKIIDINGEVTNFAIHDYEEEYLENRALVKAIVYDRKEPEPIIGGICKECVWSNPCLRLANAVQDPTLLFKLGKQKYKLREKGVRDIQDISKINVADFLKPSGKIRGVAEKTLVQWKRRAEVWLSKKAVIHTKPEFKKASKEIFYDIEDDPSLDHVYLHGFIEVTNGKKGSYKNLLALKREDEEKIARELWEYIESLSEDVIIYHYGSYEKTKANRLMEKYGLSHTIMEKFDRLRVDLYRIVESSSDWPLSSYGIKSIAKHLGFKWTSEDASGANSIAWYNDYRKSPDKNKDLLQKILTYNEEDCEAMIIVKNWLMNNN